MSNENEKIDVTKSLNRIDLLQHLGWGMDEQGKKACETNKEIKKGIDNRVFDKLHNELFGKECESNLVNWSVGNVDVAIGKYKCLKLDHTKLEERRSLYEFDMYYVFYIKNQQNKKFDRDPFAGVNKVSGSWCIYDPINDTIIEEKLSIHEINMSKMVESIVDNAIAKYHQGEMLFAESNGNLVIPSANK